MKTREGEGEERVQGVQRWEGFGVKDTRPQVGWELGTTKALAPENILGGGVRISSTRARGQTAEREGNSAKLTQISCDVVGLIDEDRLHSTEL